MIDLQTQPKKHAVFSNNLSIGVAAVARAIGVRQAKDMLYISEHEYLENGSIETQNAHIFPAGDCATAMLKIAKLAEEHIPGLDMSPISNLLVGFDDRPLRPQWTSPHDWLATLAELSIDWHLVIKYTEDEERAVARLFAAMHLAICGPLPSGHDTIVGCPDCIADDKGAKGRSNLPRFLNLRVRNGELDPAYKPREYPEGWQFGQATPHDMRPRKARLTWHAGNAQAAEAARKTLKRLGFSVELNRGHGTVHAEKMIVKGNLSDAITWGHKFTTSIPGLKWYGAETVFTIDEKPKPKAWLAFCGVCEAGFEYAPTEQHPEPAKCGTFCPNCRERKLIAPGVLHFRPV